MASLSDRFATALTALHTPPTALAVGVSGGCDSIALLHLLHQHCTAHHTPLTALTVNHGLRPEATAEAAQVASWCATLNIPHHTLTHTGERLHSNTQTHARQLRYTAMAHWCHANDVPTLAVAHHADDQAETVLQRLLRGSGIDGMAAMPPRRMEQGITLIRPLLSFTKAELKDYLTHQNFPWLEDPSNQNLDYTRNRLRAALAEAMPAEDKHLLTQRLSQFAEHCARASEALDYATTQFLSTQSENTLSTPALRALPEDIALRALMRLLQNISGNHTARPRMEELQRLHHSLCQENTGKRTLHGCIIRWNEATILLEAEHI